MYLAPLIPVVPPSGCMAFRMHWDPAEMAATGPRSPSSGCTLLQGRFMLGIRYTVLDVLVVYIIHHNSVLYSFIMSYLNCNLQFLLHCHLNILRVKYMELHV